MSGKTIVVVSDMQVPYHDRRAVANLTSFVRDFAPDALVNVGDDFDSPETARWNKQSAMEYGQTFEGNVELLKQVHQGFRDALGHKPYRISRSNHGDRTAKYIAKYAPALDGLSCLRIEQLLGYTDLGIQYHSQPFEIAPDWVCAHGDEGTLSMIAGRTAGLLAERWGVSVVCGHSHRAGIGNKSYGYGGAVTKVVTGLEVGHLMNLQEADYMSGGHADWQQAFGLLYVSQGRVSPVLVPVHNGGKFTVEGVSYGV